VVAYDAPSAAVLAAVVARGRPQPPVKSGRQIAIDSRRASRGAFINFFIKRL